MFPNALEVHGVVDFILGFEDLFERKVVMPLLQCVERYLLVVLREHIPRASSAWSCTRVGTRVPVWLLACASRRASGIVRLLVPGAPLRPTKLIGWLCGRHLLVVSLFFV